MPNTKSARRRVRRVKLQTSVNKVRKSKYKLAVKQMANYISAGKIKEAKDKTDFTKIDPLIEEEIKTPNWIKEPFR